MTTQQEISMPMQTITQDSSAALDSKLEFLKAQGLVHARYKMQVDDRTSTIFSVRHSESCPGSDASLHYPVRPVSHYLYYRE